MSSPTLMQMLKEDTGVQVAVGVVVVTVYAYLKTHDAKATILVLGGLNWVVVAIRSFFLYGKKDVYVPDTVDALMELFGLSESKTETGVAQIALGGLVAFASVRYVTQKYPGVLHVKME